jgi:phosphate transport system substrate-binding protein
MRSPLNFFLRPRLFVVALLAACVDPVRGATVDSALPRYEPRNVEPPKRASYLTANGAIAVVGYNDMAEMLHALGARFAALHPGFRFAWDLPGTKAAPAALATGKSAFAPMGAQLTPPQLADYVAVAHEPPLEIRIAHASLSAKALSGPLAIFVHRDNPLAALTLDEVAAIFSGADPARGLRPCGVGAGTALGIFFRARVLGGKNFSADFAGVPQSAEVVRRVGEDVRAIGFAAACRATPAVKMLALAERAGDPPVALTEENLTAGRYPLDRHLLIGVRPPIEPWLSEFLRFVLSRDGQAIVAGGTLGYLPLSGLDAAAELAKLR